MKKKIVLMSIAGILVLTAVIGGTLAGFSTKSEQGKTDITTKSLGIVLLEDEEVPLGAALEEVEIGMPGDEVAMPYCVKNDIDNGYELYTRVTIYKYWDEAFELSKENTQLDAQNIQLYALDNATGEKVELQPGVKINGWWVWYADEEQVIAYYTYPLATGMTTGKILDTVFISPEITNEYTGKHVMLEIQADAVQKAAASDSIPAEWGVYPVIDENDVITNIEE